MNSPKNKPAKLAIALQVCPLDVWIAQRLARLICSIEPTRRTDVDFIISPRRDTNPPAVAELARIVQEKFPNVHILRNKRMGTNWPLGPNDLWAETMMRVSTLYDTGKITATGVLTFESDCIPLRHDWIDLLAAEWADAEANGLQCVGHAHGEPEPTHINGNAIFHSKLTLKYPILEGSDSTIGWDVFHGQFLLSIGRDTNAIFQKYRMPNVSREEVEALRKGGVIPSIFHGVKGLTAIEAIEAMVTDGSFFKRAEKPKEEPQKQPSIKSKVPNLQSSAFTPRNT